jgi:hypothetical protein
MSLFAVKYLPNHGWVAAKNFDYNFKPSLFVKKSFRKNVERLYVWDNATKYTEGLNEHGVCIFSSNIHTKQNPIESRKLLKNLKNGVVEPRRYYDPSGFSIRKALVAKDVNSAVEILKQRQISGCTVVFNENTCVLMESAFSVNDFGQEEYISSTKTLSPMEVQVRCQNTFIGNESQKRESDIIVETVKSNLMLADVPNGVLNAISDDEFLISGKYKTAFQALLIPSEKKLYVRSLWCKMAVNVNRLNTVGGKTIYEIGCSNKLSFSDFLNIKGNP